MKLHNLLEDLVSKTVNDLFDEEAQSHAQGFCTCFQCRLDVMCYVLNRLPPQYTVSSRGLAHRFSDYQEQLQATADLVGLVNKGIQTVSATRRPQFTHDRAETVDLPEGPLFSFPVIEGKVLNGTTFEPLDNLAISLLSDGKLVRMLDQNWQNPYPLSEHTAGSFYFFPYPVAARSAGLAQAFEFELSIVDPRFEEFHHFIKFELNAEPSFTGKLHYQEAYRTDDLFLFPRGDQETGGSADLTD